jgi:hypothetical protein
MSRLTQKIVRLVTTRNDSTLPFNAVRPPVDARNETDAPVVGFKRTPNLLCPRVKIRLMLSLHPILGGEYDFIHLPRVRELQPPRQGVG